jgi:hypothetical protein
MKLPSFQRLCTHVCIQTSAPTELWTSVCDAWSYSHCLHAREFKAVTFSSNYSERNFIIANHTVPDNTQCITNCSVSQFSMCG